jgi:transposase
MANKRICMRKVRELLKLCYEKNYSARQAAKTIGIGKTSVTEYLAGFKASGLEYCSIAGMSDSELLNCINHKKHAENQRYSDLSKQFDYFEKELKRTGVTLQLLWEEYKHDRSDHYGYSQFCHHYYKWRKEHKVSMHMEHKAGDKMFVDFTGKKLAVTNPETGEMTEYEVFVSVLGASQLSYIEAVPSQKKADWIAVNQNALHFYGGAPAAIVPDCLKSAVIKADNYEPEVNPSYKDFAGHYGTVILPARALHPQDKSLAENFVKSAYSKIYAPLRNMVFFSLEELNHALWEQLDLYNCRKFQGRDHSRQQLFDQIEKGQLKPLVKEVYELKTFIQCKVQYNHHVYLKEDKHYYSVPFQYTGKQVMVNYTSGLVEIYHNNLRIAIHKRDRKQYEYTTEYAHRPVNHQVQVKWTPERFISWARSIDPKVELLVTKVLDSRPHPEQAYKTCMGLLNLQKKCDTQDYIKACNKALLLNCLTFKFIKNTVESKTFNLDAEQELELLDLPDHGNIRGKEYYN